MIKNIFIKNISIYLNKYMNYNWYDDYNGFA